MKKHIYGTPSLIECDGFLWKSQPQETDVTEDENFEATNSLWDYLEKKYKVGSGSWDDCFLRGTFLDERSQVLEIVYPPAINSSLISYLRDWLSGSNKNWRIILPTFLSARNAIVVYSNGIRYGDYFGETQEEEFYTSIARKMLSLQTYDHARDRAIEEGWLPRP